MRWRNVFVVAVVLSAAEISTALTAADDVSVPKRATPRLVVVNKVSVPAGTITCAWILVKPVWETQTREENGRIVAIQAVHLIAESRPSTFSLAKASFHDSQGNALSRDEFTKRLRSGDTILVSEDGKAVDQTYLRILKSDVLVLVPSADELPSRSSRRPSVPPASTPPLPAPST